MRGIRFLLLSLTALSAFTGYLIVSTTDPNVISNQVKLLFYTSVILFIAGLYGLFRIFRLPRTAKESSSTAPVFSILRQGLIIGLVVASLLILQGLRILNLLDSIFIIISAVLFELFFRVRLSIRNTI